MWVHRNLMQSRCPSLSCPMDSLPPGGQANHWGKLSRDILPPPLIIFTPGGQAVQAGLSCPPPIQRKFCVMFYYYMYLQHFNNYMQFLSYKYVNLRWFLQTFSWVSYWQRVGGKLSRAVYLALPPRISKRMDNQQFLLHHLLQKYLVERDINLFQSIWDAYIKCSVGLRIDKGWGASCPGRFILPPPPPRISERKDNQQILLHHLLQE